MSMKRALGAAALATATLTAVLPAPAASAATALKTKSISCSVRSANTWSGCAGDNARVARGKKVYLALTRSSGRRVQFRIKNHVTGKVLATPAVRLTPDGRRHLVWTNRTRAAVTIDVEARTNGITFAGALLSVR